MFDGTLAYAQLPRCEVDEFYEWVPEDQCPREVQLWLERWRMAKRLGTRVPAFPTRYISRYFGDYDINAVNGWGVAGQLDTILRDCVAPEESPGGFFELEWNEGEPVFPLRKP